MIVGTGSHAVVLGDVRPAGKRSMPATDWVRGAHLAGDLTLGSPVGQPPSS